MDLLLLDMSSLRVEAGGGLFALRSASGELLFSITTETVLRLPGLEPEGDLQNNEVWRNEVWRNEVWRREILLHVFDRALADAVIFRVGHDGVRRPLHLALYNPYTAEVSVGGIPATLVFSAASPVPLPQVGMAATLTGDVLELASGQTLDLCEPSFMKVSRNLVAHAN